MKWAKRAAAGLVVILAGPLLVALAGDVKLNQDWRTADRSVVGLAPDPLLERDAVVQIYAARAFNWRGLFAVHTWIAAKAKDAPTFTVYQVVGWQAWWGRPVVVVTQDHPDRRWYGQRPWLLLDVRGDQAAASLATIEQAVAEYPYRNEYTLWPGPNSNTFTAYVGRRVPALNLHLPTTAIGKDFLPGGQLLASAPSGTGVQVSLYGVFGLTAAWYEGLEINLLGLSMGIDVRRPALKLPGVGRIGMATGI